MCWFLFLHSRFFAEKPLLERHWLQFSGKLWANNNNKRTTDSSGGQYVQTTLLCLQSLLWHSRGPQSEMTLFCSVKRKTAKCGITLVGRLIILARSTWDHTFATSLLAIALKFTCQGKITAEYHLRLIRYSSLLSDTLKPQELAFLCSDLTQDNLYWDTLKVAVGRIPLTFKNLP